MIPLDWLRSLKQASGQPFLADSFARYGYLPNPANSAGLPVGFTAKIEMIIAPMLVLFGAEPDHKTRKTLDMCFCRHVTSGLTPLSWLRCFQPVYLMRYLQRFYE